MHYYPLFLDLRTARCLVVGAGKVGLRKTAALLECDPSLVLVLDTAPLSPAWDALAKDTRFVFEQRPFTANDVLGCTLVFAATSSREVNAAVHEACVARAVLCNVADAPEESRFIVPACARHARLTVALSTGGASPALARKMRRDFAQRLREGYAPLADVLARLRPLVLALESVDKGVCEPLEALTGQAERAALFRAVADSGLADSLALGDRARCETLLRETLPDVLHANITELLYDLA